MAKPSVAPSAVTKEQILAIIATIKFVCITIQALIPILESIIGTFEAQQKLLDKK